LTNQRQFSICRIDLKNRSYLTSIGWMHMRFPSGETWISAAGKTVSPAGMVLMRWMCFTVPLLYQASTVPLSSSIK
jgi:hypothetical protein